MKNLKLMKVKKVLAVCIICTALLVAGCEDRGIDLTKYKCTDEQLTLVAKETEICSATSYLTSHCFAQAKKTQCDTKSN